MTDDLRRRFGALGVVSPQAHSQFGSAEVKIIRAFREPALPLGTTVSQAQMAAIGPGVTGSPFAAPRKAGFETVLPSGVNRLIPFPVGGSGIVMGKAAMVARQGPVLPADAADGVRILDVTLAQEPGIPVEFTATVPGGIRKPYCSRCFVLAGQGRLIDPPIARLKEN
jgi:hypothetical protein